VLDDVFLAIGDDRDQNPMKLDEPLGPQFPRVEIETDLLGLTACTPVLEERAAWAAINCDSVGSLIPLEGALLRSREHAPTVKLRPDVAVDVVGILLGSRLQDDADLIDEWVEPRLWLIGLDRLICASASHQQSLVGSVWVFFERAFL
jgi:hypothetical protein